MLSRSSSNAGDRLRRAKSTSSAHTSSSGHHRSSTSIDPFTTRQQAEAAALEAYHRARPHQEAPDQAVRPVPPKRRRSQATGRTEGSHFEDARLGRRRSNSKRNGLIIAGPLPTQQYPQSEVTNDSNGEERVITRRRSVIPPDPSNRPSQHDRTPVPSSGRGIRKSQSEYTDGSPLPRHAPTLKDRRSTLQLRTPQATHSDGYDGNLATLSDFGTTTNAATQSAQVPIRTARETQTSEEVIAMARDKCLQDFQTKKIRERKSFMLAPFQKRRATNVQKTSESNYDTVLPPFNYGGDGVLTLPPPPPAALVVPAPTLHSEQKSRNFSDTLKGRIKKVFRKTSRSPSGLPAQHIESTRYHFSTYSPLSTPTLNPEKEEDPFTLTTNKDYLTVPEARSDRASSRQSESAQSVAKSRVTSWTNSTVAGTASTRNNAELDNSTDEHGRLKRSDSVSTLRKASSFFGRPIKNKLRRPSRAELPTSSEESAGLYSALQDRIKPSDSASQYASGDADAQTRPPSALATLPSQQQAASSISSKGVRDTPTIRSVTPDPTAYKLGVLSPVSEGLSPDAVPRFPGYGQEKEDDEPTPRSSLQRRPAMKAFTPSQEQIARRIEKSKNRWQSPLDELSPPAPRPTRAMMEDNPYELRSLSRALQQPVKSNDLPHHARVGDEPTSTRADVLSPSIYSRATDGASPRPDTPVDQGGMTVTITGREVRSYSISPQKREQPAERPIHGSHDWRKWLSDEMHGWDGSTAPEDLNLSKAVHKETGLAGSDLHVSKQRIEGPVSGQGPGSASPALETRPIDSKAQRPRANSRRSSYMNERYPMIDSGRNSSAMSDRSRNLSSRAESRTNSVRPDQQSSDAIFGKASEDDGRPTTVLMGQRVVSKHQSFAQLASVDRNKSALDSRDESLDARVADAVKTTATLGKGELASTANIRASTASRRAKSAFDMRANYRNSNNDKMKSIEVRRKANRSDNVHILEDSTIQHISAGPYASRQRAGTPADTNKENTPPSEANSLPVLSSSEWLAAGTNKKRDARKVTEVHPAYRDRSVSRYSPSRTANASVASGGNSPGQRLVTNWLDGKRSKQNSPAFV